MHRITSGALARGLLAFALLLGLPAHGQLCRLDYIAGLREEANIGKRIVGSNVSDPNQAKVWLTFKNDGMYAHSNFVTTGYDRPTKAFGESMDLFTTLANVTIDPTKFDDAIAMEREFARLTGPHASRVKYYLDASVFDSTGSPRIDLAGAGRVYASSGGGWHELTRVSAPGSPEFALKRYGVYVPFRREHRPTLVVDALKAERVEVKKTHVLSFVRDSATQEELASLGLGPRLHGTEVWSDAKLESTFASMKGETAVIVAHLEGKECVVIDLRGEPVYRVAVSRFQELADEHRVRLVTIGCHSVEHARWGMQDEINSVDAAKRLKAALHQRDMLSFFKELAGDDLWVLLPEAAPRAKQSSRITVVERAAKFFPEAAELLPALVPVFGAGLYLVREPVRDEQRPQEGPGRSELTTSSVASGKGNPTEDDGKGPSRALVVMLLIGGALAVAGVLFRR